MIELDPYQLEQATKRLMQKAMRSKEFQIGFLDGCKDKIKGGGILSEKDKGIYQNLLVKL